MKYHLGRIIGFLLLVIIVIDLPFTIYIAQKPQQTHIAQKPQQTHIAQKPQQTQQQTVGGGNALYVSPSGSNSNPGTQTAPFATIEKADSVATPGTTIHVAPG